MMNKLNRSASVEGVVDADGRVTFPLSSEEPYRRYDGIEVLEHTPKAVDLKFLRSGNAPLLDSHDRYTGLQAVIGVIEDAWLEDSRVYVTARFGTSDRALQVRRDVENGIIRNVSVGYEVNDTTPVDSKGVYRVSKWRPYEASFVPIPADITVGIGRSHQPMEHTMNAQVAAPAALQSGAALVAPPVPDEQRIAAFNTAVDEINTLAKAHARADLAGAFITGAVARGETPSVAYFKGILASNLPDGKPLVNTDIGMTAKERSKFSVMRLAKTMAQGDNNAAAREDAAFELEVVAATASQARNNGFVLPTDVLASWGDFEVDGVSSRQLSRAALSTGTSTVSNILTTDLLAASFIENLRDALAIGQLGVTMLPGLSDNVDIPGADANIVAAWLASEDANAAESNPSFRKVSLSPKDVAGYTDLTRRMLQQSAIGIEAYVRGQLVRAIAEKIDLAAFYGAGSSGVPRGLKNTSGIGAVTFAGAVPTRNELIDMRAAIRATNQMATTAMVFDTTMESDLMKSPVDAGSGIFLANGSGRLQTNDAYVMTNALSAGDVFAGVFSDMVMGMWGGLELGRSTEAKFLSGGVRLRAIQTVDFGVTRVGSFVYGADA